MRVSLPVQFCRADRSVSTKHSRTNSLACTMPRFRRSDELRLPVYVGRMSRPISSMTANSWAYLLTPAADANNEALPLPELAAIIEADVSDSMIGGVDGAAAYCTAEDELVAPRRCC